MRVLCIGNSFSQNATTYLHQFAAAAGGDIDVYNLYIGGCPLERHCRNIDTDEAAYDLQHNGDFSHVTPSSISAPFADGPWDVVTIQQASHDSGDWSTYEPYLSRLAGYVHEKAPEARLMIHQTWAYETDAAHPRFPRYHRDQAYMHYCLSEAYGKAAQAVNADWIPCGNAVQKVRGLAPFDRTRDENANPISADGFHMNLRYGCYLLAAVWVETLLGIDVRNVHYIPDGSDADPAALAVLRQAAHDAVAEEKAVSRH